MNYAYLFVDNLNGHSYENGLNELRASVSTFKNIQKYDSIYVFNNEVKGKNINYFKKQHIIHNTINLSRNYHGSDNGNPISILVEKIIQLMNFDESKEIVLMDIDTSSQKTIPEDFFNSNWVVFDNIEYPIMQWRNLDKVLPQIPWKQFDINFDSSFMMYNTGVIYIPKKFRKELCEKALKIVDYLNNNFDPNERYGNKLDEQIALSIVCHDTFGRFGHIKYSSEYLHHHWDDRQNGIKWWENINSQYEEFDDNQERNNCTLVTGLWDISRVNLNGIWKRSFDEYIEKFTRLLETDNNLIIFGDENLRDIVFKYRDDKNTQFIQLDSSWFRNTSYYPLIQKIRTDGKWINQKEWIKDSPQATLELYNPVVMSKMPLMDIAIEQSKFNVDYFYWVDAGIRADSIHFSKQVLEDIGDYSQFFFTCFPYIDTEIHGFDTNKVKEIISDDPTMVARATFWGGNKDRIKRINSLYMDLIHKTLNEGFMGTEETLFTILTYKNPDLIDYYKLNESDNNGDPTVFLQRFKESENKSDLFQKNEKKINISSIEINKLPISIGILSWNSNKTLRNTLNSYKQNGLFDIVDNIILFFQEISDEDRKLAKEYNIPFISSEENIGIGNAFIKLVEVSKEENILLLEHDWELTENIEKTFLYLKQGIDMLNSGYHCVRYRSIKNPGYPLYVQNAYQGNELNHYDPTIDLTSPHLFECRHWIQNINEIFPDKIQKENDYFTTTSRWSSFTNNPCMYKKDFYFETVFPFKQIKEKSLEYQKNFGDNLTHYGSVEPWKHSLEVDIGYWWARQDFKVAWGEGLFTHNDIQKYGIAQNISDITESNKKSISFIFAHRESDVWSTPLSIVNQFKELGWKTEIYSLFDSNDNYIDDNIHKLLTTTPDIIMHMDWGQHTSSILSELKKTGAYCIMESADDPQRFQANSIKAPWFDLILSPDIRCVEEYRRNGFNAEWWTHFTDTNTYFPLDIEPVYIAVCSRGMGNDAFIIDSLSEKYPHQIKNQNGFFGSEHNDFLNSGSIILQQSRYGEITRRIFEGMSCKKLVIADRLDSSTKIQDLFVEGEDIVFYNDENDCLNKLVYYSNNPEEAKRIAENGYKKVLENHTQEQRVDFIIQKYKSVVR